MQLMMRARFCGRVFLWNMQSNTRARFCGRVFAAALQLTEEGYNFLSDVQSLSCVSFVGKGVRERVVTNYTIYHVRIVINALTGYGSYGIIL